MTVRPAGGAAVLVAGLMLAGCGTDDQCEAGAAVVTELSPSLVLASVVGIDGAPVPRVELSHLRLDGRPVHLDLLVSAAHADGLVLDDGRLGCTLPCGLPGLAGRWQARLVAPDGSAARLDAHGDPTVHPGGCSDAVEGEVPEVDLQLSGPRRDGPR